MMKIKTIPTIRPTFVEDPGPRYRSVGLTAAAKKRKKEGKKKKKTTSNREQEKGTMFPDSTGLAKLTFTCDFCSTTLKP